MRPVDQVLTLSRRKIGESNHDAVGSMGFWAWGNSGLLAGILHHWIKSSLRTLIPWNFLEDIRSLPA